MSPENAHKLIRIYMGGLILGVNTLYMLSCFLKQFALVGKGLSNPYKMKWMTNKVTSGEIQIGREIVQTTYSSYTTDPSTLSISETTKQISAREIPIKHIRQ